MDTARFFDDYFNNAAVNAILVMDPYGIVLDANQSFIKNFGYEKDEIKGKHFKILFNHLDQTLRKPEKEVETVLSTGQANDENYIVHKNGHEIWCTGETILVKAADGQSYLVKDIINLQAKKQLQLFLSATEELLQRIFDSSGEIPMMILDGSMKVQKVNQAFVDLFEIGGMPDAGSRLSDINHTFWQQQSIKKELSSIIVTNQPLRRKEFMFTTKSGETKLVMIDSKIIDNLQNGKTVFLIIEDITPKNQSNNQRFQQSF